MGGQTMNRRSFLSQTLIILTGLCNLPLLTACGSQGTSGTEPQIAPGASLRVIPTTVPTAFPEPDTETMAGWMRYYANILQIPVSFQSVDDLLVRLDNYNKAVVQDVNNRMIRNKFNDFSEAKVYTKGDSFFYTVLSQDGRNACGAFFAMNLGKESALLEGPAALGTTLGARDYLKQGGKVDDTSSIFLPKSTQQEALGKFEKSYKQPGVYSTDAGTLSLNYTSDQRGSGQISLLAQDKVGGRLFERNYDVNWS
jgi:hypothetical protein